MILFLVIYTAIFTPYVAAFLLNEPGYSDRSSDSYGSDPIVIIDLIGDIPVIARICRRLRKIFEKFSKLLSLFEILIDFRKIINADHQKFKSFG